MTRVCSLFFEESDYKCITGTLLEFHRTHCAHLTLPYLFKATQSAVVDRFWTVDLISPTVKTQIPCPFHLTI